MSVFNKKHSFRLDSEKIRVQHRVNHSTPFAEPVIPHMSGVHKKNTKWLIVFKSGEASYFTCEDNIEFYTLKILISVATHADGAPPYKSGVFPCLRHGSHVQLNIF